MGGAAYRAWMETFSFSSSDNQASTNDPKSSNSDLQCQQNGVTHIFAGKSTMNEYDNAQVGTPQTQVGTPQTQYGCVPGSAFVDATRYANKLHAVCPLLFCPLAVSDLPATINTSTTSTSTVGTAVGIHTSAPPYSNTDTDTGTVGVGVDIGARSGAVYVRGEPLMFFYLLPLRRRGEVERHEVIYKGVPGAARREKGDKGGKTSPGDTQQRDSSNADAADSVAGGSSRYVNYTIVFSVYLYVCLYLYLYLSLYLFLSC